MAVFKRGQTYYIEYRVDGEKRRMAIGASKKLAETVLSKYKVQVVENRHLDKARSDNVTFEQLSDDYMILTDLAPQPLGTKSPLCHSRKSSNFLPTSQCRSGGIACTAGGRRHQGLIKRSGRKRI